MVDDLLDVSRATAGRIELDRHPMAIDAVIRDAVEQTRPLLDARGHACQVTLPHGQVCVHANAKRLVQVFANVLNNAVKYTAPGGTISIRVDATHASHGGNELAHRLRSQPANAKALMVAISSYGSEPARQTAFDAGFDHYLTKPADIGRPLEILS